jgi:hypothetical protein
MNESKNLRNRWGQKKEKNTILIRISCLQQLATVWSYLVNTELA